MTEIEFGGGSSTEQRSAFCAPHDGSQLTGYTGHCHQYRFAKGRSFGYHTHKLSQEFCDMRRPVPELKEPYHGIVLVNELPEATGDNRLFKEMKSGYSGYVPRKLFKSGKSFSPMCDLSIDEHTTNYHRTLRFENCMRNTIESLPKYQVLNHDPHVRDHLNTYRDTRPMPPVLAEYKREFTEPPIRTYNGFVPRVGTTDCGLGLNFREASCRGYCRMKYETDHHFDIIHQPINKHCSPSSVPPTENPVCKRVYLNDGMIPRWTGKVPGLNYVFGMTYGDGTRSLEVCSHCEDCYGDHMRCKGPTSSIVIS